MDVLLCTASIWHMCTMSLDRYCTLRYPISYGRSRTRTSVALKIAFVWVVSTAVSAALAVAGFADYSNVYVDGQCVPAVKEFVLYGSIFAFYVPLVIMVATYVLTVRILAENRRSMTSIGLQTTFGREKIVGGDDWVMRGHSKSVRVEPSAAATASELRQPQPTEGPPSAPMQYRRRPPLGGVILKQKSAGSTAGQLAVKRQRRGSRSLMSVLDSNGWTGPRSDAYHSDHYYQLLRNASSAVKCRPSSSTPQLTAVSDPECSQVRQTAEDDQSCWTVSCHPRAPLRNSSAERRRNFVCHSCCRPRLQSDRSDISTSCSHNLNEPTNRSLDFVEENNRVQLRRLSDGALQDRGTYARRSWWFNNQFGGAKWSLNRSRKQWSWCGEPQRASSVVSGTRTSPVVSETRRLPFFRARNSPRPVVTDTVGVNWSDRPKKTRPNRVLSPEVLDMDDESLQCGADGIGIKRFIYQRRMKPADRDDQKQTPAVTDTSDRSSTTQRGNASASDRLKNTPATKPATDRTSERGNPNNELSDSVRPSVSVTGDYESGPRSSWLQRDSYLTVTDASLSPSSVSQSAADRFQMSAVRHRCHSASAATLTTRSVTYKRRHSIATNERKASKVLGIIFAVFVLLWTPFFVINIVSVVCDTCLEALGPTGMSSLVWLGYASSLANPIVYTMFSTSFRTVFYKILTCQVCRAPERTCRRWQSATSYRLSRQATLGDALASVRHGHPPPEIAGLISHGGTVTSR